MLCWDLDSAGSVEYCSGLGIKWPWFFLALCCWKFSCLLVAFFRQGAHNRVTQSPIHCKCYLKLKAAFPKILIPSFGSFNSPMRLECDWCHAWQDSKGLTSQEAVVVGVSSRTLCPWWVKLTHSIRSLRRCRELDKIENFSG